jgi:hypothetical protein
MSGEAFDTRLEREAIDSNKLILKCNNSKIPCENLGMLLDKEIQHISSLIQHNSADCLAPKS